MATAVHAATPSAVDAERALLGSIFLDPAQMLTVADTLPPTSGPWFYHEAHRLIYDACVTLFQRRDPIDLTTVTDVLLKRGQLDKIGGSLYLAELTEVTVTTANTAHYARIVRDKCLLRGIINIATDLQASAYEQDDVADLVSRAHQALLRVANAQSTAAFTPLSTLLTASVHEVDHISHHGSPGITTGFHELDAKLNGFQNSDLIIVAARPGMGKTALGLQFAATAARATHLPVAVFSLEMSKSQLSMRLVCAEARLDMQDVRRGFLTDPQRIQFYHAADRLSDLSVLVDDTPSASVMDLRARCQRLQMDGGLAMVVIDYLQLLQPSRRRDNRVQEVTDISRDLKILAKELHVPVIALAQLNRSVEQCGDHVPVLSGLRESGSIEQDADVVMFIYRPEKSDDHHQSHDTAGLVIAKQRNGPTGELRLLFHQAYARFNPLADRHQYEMAVSGD